MTYFFAVWLMVPQYLHLCASVFAALPDHVVVPCYPDRLLVLLSPDRAGFHAGANQMEKIDLSKKNPFHSYSSNFGAYFSFGKDFDEWVCATMLEGLLIPGDEAKASVQMADIGAGSCYWARHFLRAVPNLYMTAIDPSEDLIVAQAGRDLMAETKDVQARLNRRCMTAQEFAAEEINEENRGKLDCIYFMQSAHYVGEAQFDAVFTRYARRLRPERGRIVIQARNMTEDWYPWAFPYEWKERVEGALHATAMFGRADRYRANFEALGHIFSDVDLHERTFDVFVDAEDYWERLENRWIPTFMSEDIIPPRVHREGIDGMKGRFAAKGEKRVHWLEKYALVVARV